MNTPARMDGISLDVKMGQGIRKHGLIEFKCIPMLLGNAVACFTTTNNGKVERPVQEGVGSCEVNPHMIQDETVPGCMILQSVGTGNQVCAHCVEDGRCLITLLEPKPLIYLVVMLIGWMCHVEVDQEPPIQKTGWVQSNRIFEGNANQAPLPMIAPDGVKDKKQSVGTGDDQRCQGTDRRHGMLQDLWCGRWFWRRSGVHE